MGTYKVIGLMSGTSLDGLDIAYCIFKESHGLWTYDIKQTRHIVYSDLWNKRLKNGIKLSDHDLVLLTEEYGDWIGKQVADFILDYNLSPDIVASHGHTVKHAPQDGLTLQVGSGQIIADRCQVTTISDFRSLDVSLGGQGAPLVPIGDRDLFADFDVCLNLGGIANISFDLNGKRIAYDIGIANMVLNYLANLIGQEYDESGKIARGGKVDSDLLYQLNSLDYYHLTYPKSTGYEWFRDEIIPIINTSRITTQDKLCTACHHIADMVAEDINQYTTNQKNRMLITGGGANNIYLVDLISDRLSQHEIIIPDHKILEYKEALIFAFLGVKKIRNENNCLRSVTGAIRDSCGGRIFYPV